MGNVGQDLENTGIQNWRRDRYAGSAGCVDVRDVSILHARTTPESRNPTPSRSFILLIGLELRARP